MLTKCHEAGDKRATYALATWYLHGNALVNADVKLGIDLLVSLKNSNVAEALYDLAVSYDLGLGIRRNARAAFEHYLKAAVLGYGPAKQVSEYFRTGELVKRSDALRKFWVQRRRIRMNCPQQLETGSEFIQGRRSHKRVGGRLN